MKIQALKAAALIALLAMAATACDSDDSESSKGSYVLGFRTSADPTADYVLYSDDLSSGTVSATGQGIEQLGWSYYTKVGSDRYMAFDYDNSIATSYQFKDGQLSETGQFAFERADLFSETIAGTNSIICIGAPWGGGSYDCQIQVVDASTASITKAVTTPIYKSFYDGKQQNAWPTATWIQNSKLYVAFYPLVGDTWFTPNTDTAYVSVYSYPALEYQSTFKDARTGPIGYYASQPCVLEDESGNHYTLSHSSIASGFTQATKPSGILKINAGETKFDANYFFNVEALGYKVMAGAYAGNGKVVARVVSADLDKTFPIDSWASFSVTDAPIHNIAVLDLNAKTLKIIDSVPMHGGQYRTPLFVENGKVWASITVDKNNVYLYEIDAATATATKGARIEGSEIQGINKF